MAILGVKRAILERSKDMIDVIKAQDRHFSDFGWLKTYWLFSFSRYFDPHNIQFGALRVFNDDVVEPGTGFPTHPHEEMEIITIVLKGEMTHEDSMGNKAVIKAGDVQRMSAGTGLTHSEFNLADRPVHFYQVWIYPDESGLEPTYGQRTYDPSEWKNRLLPVASGQNLQNVVTFHTDATIYRCDLEAGRKITFDLTKERRIFIYLTKGHLSVNGQQIAEADQARVDVEEPLVLAAEHGAEFILIDVPSCKGWGYSDETFRGGKK
jgi:redox-sensitive bicupin YhaK (pirin superfamily)